MLVGRIGMRTQEGRRTPYPIPWERSAVRGADSPRQGRRARSFPWTGPCGSLPSGAAFDRVDRIRMVPWRAEKRHMYDKVIAVPPAALLLRRGRAAARPAADRV